MTTGRTTISLKNDTSTDRLGATLAQLAQPGDCILLSGQIGAGKSALARAFIRELLGPDTDVPSPTFTLVQTYEHDTFDIWHADLYRLSDPQEVVELGLVDAFENDVTLIEWPELLGDLAPETALRIQMSVHATDHRADMVYGPNWADRIAGISSDAQ